MKSKRAQSNFKATDKVPSQSDRRYEGFYGFCKAKTFGNLNPTCSGLCKIFPKNFFYFLLLFLLSTFNQVCAEEVLIKVGLEDEIDKVYITANKNYKILAQDFVPNKEQPNTNLLMKKNSKQVTLLRAGKKTNKLLVVASKPDLSTTNSDLIFVCSDRESKTPCIFQLRYNRFAKSIENKYRGALLIKPSRSSFKLINILDIESYLKGVVANEMPAYWHSEALKAQAVAARTYTHRNLGRRKALGYDLKATVEDQVYMGYSGEHSRTNEAIEKTQGKILIDKQGKAIQAFYSSHAGGYTASLQDTWGLTEETYLQPVKSHEAGYYSWSRSISHSKLQQAFQEFGSPLHAVSILKRSPDSRVNQIMLSNQNGKHHSISGEEFRHKLSLPSTNFTLKPESTQLKIQGRGFGHGIGMSQHGAQELAKKGWDYKKILELYYPGARLKASRS